MKELDVVLERPKVIHMNERMRYKEIISEKGKAVLSCLLKQPNSNLWEIRKFLKLHYSTVFKVLKEQMSGNTKFVKIEKRQNKKNKTQNVLTYSLSDAGYRALVNPIYYGKSGDNASRIKELKEIFKNVTKNYPAFIPELFRKLPEEYCVCFYPFFSGDLVSPFLRLLEAKSKETEKTQFVIDNSYFQCEVPLSQKELKPLVSFATKELTKLEKFHGKALNNILEKKALLNGLRNI